MNVGMSSFIWMEPIFSASSVQLVLLVDSIQSYEKNLSFLTPLSDVQSVGGTLASAGLAYPSDFLSEEIVQASPADIVSIRVTHHTLEQGC